MIHPLFWLLRWFDRLAACAVPLELHFDFEAEELLDELNFGRG